MAGYLLDDRHQIFNIYGSQCGKCKYLQRIELSCEAFPEGIPDKLLEGKSTHNKPIKGQTGNFVFFPA